MWLRLRQIALMAPELQPEVDAFCEVLGLEVCFVDPGVGHYGLENALLPLGNQFVELLAPIAQDTAGGRYLERRNGSGGYMVITQCDERQPRRARIESLGIRLVSDHQGAEFMNMQLHPKDTGGSFLEIDEQTSAGADAPDGPWAPAGGADWKKAQRLDRVTGIRAAEIQADDPEAVAARWSEIVEIGVSQDGAGHPCIALENATLRFVPCTDHRPEGLAGLDLETTDREGVLASARERDCVTGDAQIMLCGMRLNLV